MQFAKISKALVGTAVLAMAGTLAFADVNDKKTTLTVKETIEVPGATLEPGEYVVKLVDSQANRHIVRFLNKEEDEVLTTVIAIPNSRLKATGDTQFAWHETPAGQPPALKAWFYPGDTFGQEFAYPEGRATELSAMTSQEVAHVSDDEARMAATQAPNQQERTIAQAPATRPQPDNSAAEREAAQQARERQMAAQRERDMQAQRDRERQIAQAEQNQRQNPDPSLTAQQQTQRSQPVGNELPETAGLGMLLALIGLGSLGASRAVRKLR